MEKKKRASSNGILAPLLGLVFLFGVWYLLAYLLQRHDNFTVPYPHATLWRVGEMLFGKDAKATWTGEGVTFLRLLLGWSFSLILGCVFGVLAGLFPKFKGFLSPGVGIARAIPTVAVVLILVGIILGSGQHRYLTFVPSCLVFLVAFPILYEAFCSGVENEPEEEKDALALDAGKRSFRGVIQVILPDSRPYIVLGIAQSLGLSMKVTVMSEVLCTNSAVKPGIGNLLRLAQQNSSFDDVPAYAIIALLMMFVIDIPFILLKRQSKRDEAE